VQEGASFSVARVIPLHVVLLHLPVPTCARRSACMAHVKVVLWSLCGLGIPTRKDPDPAGGSFFSADVDAEERRGAWVGDREEGRFRTYTPLSFRPRTCGMETKTRLFLAMGGKERDVVLPTPCTPKVGIDWVRKGARAWAL